MIGVLPRPDQVAVVQEFFELFKTPWEFYRPDYTYDVVLSTTGEIPDARATLLLVYVPQALNRDASDGIAVAARPRSAFLKYQESSLPIYGPLVTFRGGSVDGAIETTSGEIAGLRLDSGSRRTMRLGYDLFHEVQFLLSTGQPLETAHVPTLDLHISMLRDWIVGAGVTLVEIPPNPSGHAFAVCLTHDIDFIGIRNHRFDHSAWGFIYRSTVGAVGDVLRRRITLERLCRMWRAVATLPFVYLGWARDFWEPFEWYLRIEKGLPATYFLIPFKGRAGEHVKGPHSSRRATAYDVSDLAEWSRTLIDEGCEIGVHGIDAWHSVDKGRHELARIAEPTGQSRPGVRMHWLLQAADTAAILDQAGYAYDSTAGYNETTGYRNGTGQVFRPRGAQSLLELPLHIQDGALFYPQRLDLSEREAEARCETLIGDARARGGVLTVLWHDRSHGPERFWGDFYVRLVEKLKASDGWFGTAGQVVGWFRKRRAVRFDCTSGEGRTFLRYDGDEIVPPLTIRLYGGRDDANGARGSSAQPPSRFVDVFWNGKSREHEIHLHHRSELLRS